ncbi:MAG: hypothetical protein ACI9J3_001110 [Parvicellaceae bacterium]
MRFENVARVRRTKLANKLFTDLFLNNLIAKYNLARRSEMAFP